MVFTARVSAQSYTFTTLANVYSTAGVAVDGAGNTYASGIYNHAIYKITPGGTVSILAGSQGAGNADGVGTAARFANPRGIAIDGSGTLYVADMANHAIRKITPNGTVTTLAGLPGTRGWDDGAGSVARFDQPQGVAADASGNVFVADTGTRTIRKITPAGVVTTLAGLGYVTGTADGTGLDARFDQPQGVAVDAAGVVYVADTANHTIRRITPAGVVTTLAGSPTNRGFADGVGRSARFDGPQALAVDAAGNLFIADTNNYIIRKITAGGVVTTIGGLAGFGAGTSGTGSNARFYYPRGIAAGANGGLYISDSDNVRLGTPANQLAFTVQPQSQVVAAGSGMNFNVTVTGAPPITYQWQKDLVPIAGATTAILNIASVQASHTGNYTVSATNPVGTFTSSVASLTVLSPLPNDNFASAQTISGTTGQVSGITNGATGELDEPTHSNPAATASSVWYRWTPAESGTVIIDSTSSTGVFMAGYTGASLDRLSRVAIGTNRLTFAATAGTTYNIAVGSTSATQRGNFTLTWRTILNDAFANAQTLAGASGQVSGNNTGATAEPGEPVHFPGSAAASTSLWYKWTAPQSGTVIVDNTGTLFTTVIALYTGSSLSTLTLLTNAGTGNIPEATAVNVTAGTTYYIAVGSYGYSTGAVVLNWRFTQLPFIGTQSGNTTAVAGANVTLQAGVVSFQTPTFQWQRNGVVIAGATNASLTLSNVQAADAGTYILVANNGAGSATAKPIVLTVLVPPPNDNFTSAQIIAGLTGSVSGTNANATGEPGEPSHWNAAGAASSVWYRWIPSTSGLAVIDTVGSNFDTVLAVYTGSSLATLTRIVQDDDRGGGRTSQVSFAATGGVTYWIAVGGSTPSARGNLTLGWQLSPTVAITAAPVGQTIAVGGAATFTVQASGTGLTYQWYRNGVAIPAATTSSLTVSSVQGGSDASYTVSVSNGTTTITSEPATLAVAAPAATTLSLRRSRAEGNLLWSIAASTDELVAVGSYGVILSSSDNGATWTPRDSGTNVWLVAVTYGGGQFVIVGEGGLILTSPDGHQWTRSVASGTTERLNGVIYADGKYVAVGENGAAVTSPDARVWTARSTPVNTWLHGLTYHAGIRHFAACGENGVFLFSPDGVTWTRLPVPNYTSALQQTVAVDSYAHFVAVGEEGMVVSVRRNELVLKDGQPVITWTAETHPTGTNTHFIGLAQGAGALFATGFDGKVITATSDRGPWYTVPTGTSRLLLAGLFHNDTLFVVGENEMVLQSERMFGSRLINISTRGQVGTGSNLMISGFVVTGDRPKTVLVRAAGPTLASSFNLTGTLAAPVLTLVDSQNRTIATNTGWGTNANAAALSATAARVGAFPFTANSADSALLTTLTPGAYTALISGVNNGTGLSIVEVYDVDTMSNEGSRAINISTRGIAGSGQNKMIAGFVIDGASSRRVLIRAVGPTLGAAPFNVGGTLAEPQLELYNSRNLLHATAGAWSLQSSADEIRGAAKSVSAFDLPEGSKDAAMVVTLLPGAWTVQVGGSGNATGVVLVEVYALP